MKIEIDADIDVSELVQAIKEEDNPETVVSSLGNIYHAMNERDEGGFGSKITRIAVALERIADSLERTGGLR